jgi:hypothetical protein
MVKEHGHNLGMTTKINAEDGSEAIILKASAVTRTLVHRWMKLAVFGGLVVFSAMATVLVVIQRSVVDNSYLTTRRQLREELSVDVDASRRLVAETALKAEYLGFFRDTILNLHYNFHRDYKDGASSPPNSAAVSMAGQRR